MDISYNWLKDLAETDLPPQILAEKLTNAGLTVEGVHEKNDDFVFDIDLTSNRSDCLSHLGVAREISAILNSSLQIPGSELEKNSESVISNTELVKIEDADLCQRFTARIIRNVKVAPSPDWLKKRLEAVGERSINNIADITNYVMLELGQPMHAFDFNKLGEKRIVVRRARGGETIKTLDGIERKLDETMLVICDAEKPVAVAGVMGGEFSAISDETTDVLIEVAYFKRENIRRTSRRLNLSTEASYRFERGVDIENLIRASNRAAKLIGDLAGGEIGALVDVYPTRFIPNEIESKDIQYAVRRLTGLDIEKEEIVRILSALGITRKSETLYLSPSWRHDIAIEEDLVEEAARIYGYDKIAEELPPSTGAGEYQPNETRKLRLRQTLANAGFDEAINYSFIDTRNDDKFDLIPNFVDENSDEKYISLKDSIIEGSTRMRPTLLSGLLEAVRANFNHQRRDIKLFELGKVFSAAPQENDLPNERELFALVVTGGETLQNKAMPLREYDFFDAKGALESAANALNISALEFNASDAKHLQKGQSAKVLLNGAEVGTIGRLSDEIASAYKFKQPVYVAEVDLENLLQAKEVDVSYKSLPIFPSSARDVSLLANRRVNFTDIKKSIEAGNFELLRKVELVDVYEGKGMADDERSITVRLEYRSDERTLNEEEIEKIHDRILQNLADQLDAKQRF